MITLADFHPIWIAAPQNAGQTFTILLLHGTGGNEQDLIPAGKLFANVNLLSVRGRVQENGMNRFFRRLGMGIFDVEDLKLRAIELTDFLVLASEQYGFDKTKVFALGYSNGANIAGALLLMKPEILAGAILLRPMIPFLPEADWKLPATSVLINAGKADNTMNPAESEKWVNLLSQAGAEVSFQQLDTGHDLTSQDFELAVKWFGENIYQ